MSEESRVNKGKCNELTHEFICNTYVKTCKHCGLERPTKMKTSKIKHCNMYDIVDGKFKTKETKRTLKQSFMFNLGAGPSLLNATLFSYLFVAKPIYNFVSPQI